MDTGKINNKKSFKKQLFETIHTRLDSTLVQYRDILGEKKMGRFLKRTSKELASEINKETKHAKTRQEKLVKKATKLEKKKEV